MERWRMMSLIFVLVMLPGHVCGREQPDRAVPRTGPAGTDAMRYGCTVFSVSKGEKVFFAGNDDYIYPDSYYWIDTGDEQNYGAIWIGEPDNVQQGVNEKGLAYDANGLPSVSVDPHTERGPVRGGYTSYPIHILHQCATVVEVIDWVDTHEWHSHMHDQMHFADATGDAVVISAGPDGELVFTRKPAGDGFLVSTNFNVAWPANGTGYPCWRYDRATELLGRIAGGDNELTVRDAAGVLNAVHVEGANGWTIESMVADLSNGIVYLYYFHQFDRPVVLDVEEELARQRSGGPLSALFPDDVREEAARRFQVIQEKAKRCQGLGIAWLVSVIASIVLVIVSAVGRGRGSWFWVLPVSLLGPLALLVWIMAGRRQDRGTWRSVMIETVGDMTPLVVAFMTYLLLVVLVPGVQSRAAVQAVLVIGMPVIISWLIFHGLLLAPAAEKGYARFLFQRLAQVLVTVNLGMAGTFIIVMPLVTLSIRMCPVLPLTAWTVMIWWCITALGTLAGGMLVALYEGWTAKHGFGGWRVLAGKHGKVRTPPWRRLWWWILISYVVLFAGFAAGAILS